MAVISAVWIFLYNPDIGLINRPLQWLSFGVAGHTDWLGDPETAMNAILIMSVWQGVGFQMMLFLAGLQGIPTVRYEAASIDGANGWQRFRHVTRPGLGNTTAFVAITTAIASFRLLTQVDVMTQGPRDNATSTVIFHAIRVGLGGGDLGYASAISVVFFMIVVAPTFGPPRPPRVQLTGGDHRRRGSDHRKHPAGQRRRRLEPAVRASHRLLRRDGALGGVGAMPIVFLLVSAFKPVETIFADLRAPSPLAALLPTALTLDNFKGVFDRTPFPRYLFDSLFIATTTVALGILVNSMAAFALPRMAWRGRGPMLTGIVALLVVPFEAIAIPRLFVVNPLPWIDIGAGGVELRRSWINSYREGGHCRPVRLARQGSIASRESPPPVHPQTPERMNVAIVLEDKWIWDFWLAQNGNEWHAYFLQADKAIHDPELRHRNVTIGHAVSRDLVSWTYLGTCFGPSAGPAWDDWTTWTGSVLQGPDKVWHLFYTGTSHGDGGMQQRIGHATSTDMHSWQRVGNGLVLDASGPDYEPYTPGAWHDGALRDPWVIPNPDGAGWLMFFTARVPGIAEANAGGSIGLATSEDLEHWTLRPPVYRGGMFGQLEVPQVLEHDGLWYCMFCTAAEHWSEAYRRFNPQQPVCGTHYLMARHPLGPWEVAPGEFLDGATPCRRYAGKLVEADDGLGFLGFIYTTPDAAFVGAVSDPIPVSVAPGGQLILRPELLPPGATV